MTQKQIEEALKKCKGKYVTIFYNNDTWSGRVSVVSVHVEKSSVSIGESNGTLDFYSYWNACRLYFEFVLAITSGNKTPHTVLTFGADPELFFVNGDNVMVPSTEVMPADTEGVTRDGFQVELHPHANQCRQLAANHIRNCLSDARRIATDAGLRLSYKLAYTVTDDVWKRTPRTTKQFGCHPTENAQETQPKRSSGQREKFRAGGGHIHVGQMTKKMKDNLPTLVKIMDIVVGNTLVLLDRDEANITRRKNYGRAGEYRPKPYGMEYRVPSNFWLKHYVLWSLATGQIRNAITHFSNGQAQRLLKQFDMKDIRNAINNNDYDLALKNFNKYTAFLEKENIPTSSGISVHNYKNFLGWLELDNPLKELGSMSDKAIDKRWTSLSATSEDGFERFISDYPQQVQ